MDRQISPEFFMSFFAYFILDTGIAGLSPRAHSAVTYLVVVLHKLYNDFDLCVAVLDADEIGRASCRERV